MSVLKKSYEELADTTEAFVAECYLCAESTLLQNQQALSPDSLSITSNSSTRLP
jgi:hypothetical protein